MVGVSMSCVIRTAGAHVDILESIQVTFCFLGLLQVFILAHFLFLFFGWKAYRGWRCLSGIWSGFGVFFKAWFIRFLAIFKHRVFLLCQVFERSLKLVN